MRFNPPPNWPPPPEGWTPPEGWSPDPSWPPAPDGWELFVEDEPAAADVERVSRPQSVGDEGEYFGKDRAWSDDTAEPTGSPGQDVGASAEPAELTPDRLSVEHVGRVAMIRWEDNRRYEIGTVAGVSADATGITVHLKESGAVPFLREESRGGQTNPRLFVWP